MALGWDCMADVNLLRAEPGMFGRVASDPTVSRLIDTLAADAEHAFGGNRGCARSGQSAGVGAGR